VAIIVDEKFVVCLRGKFNGDERRHGQLIGAKFTFSFSLPYQLCLHDCCTMIYFQEVNETRKSRRYKAISKRKGQQFVLENEF